MTTSPLTEQQLADIDARQKAATEGPWTVSENYSDVLGPDGDQLASYWNPTSETRNGEFIANAPEDVRALLAEVRRLRTRVAELEGPAVHARAALAALCYDLEDPGSNAFGALYLLSQATVGVDAPKDDAALALSRYEAQVMRRCAEFVRDTYAGEWADDAAATLERDAAITERGCPGWEKEYLGVSDAKRRLANCKHCGKPRAAHPAAVPTT
jgi:hypothetical protein